MKNLFVQFTVIVFLFCGVWVSLSQVDWRSLLRIDAASNTTEEKLGELYSELFKNTETEIHTEKVLSTIDSLLKHICEKNGIDREDIKLHLIRKDEVNAFALPDRHLVVYSGLIEACENESELSGVLGHEIAHMEKNHVMKKLIKEVGLSVLISITTGNGNSEVIQQTAKLLSSSAYDRSLESEADITAVDYLLEAEMDAEPFANFLFKLSLQESDLQGKLFWISTHPGSEDRAKEILDYLKDKKKKSKPVLTTAQWEALQKAIKERE